MCIMISNSCSLKYPRSILCWNPPFPWHPEYSDVYNDIQQLFSKIITVCTQAKETTMRMKLWVSVPMSVTELRQLQSLWQHSQSALRPRNRILSMRFLVPGRTTSKRTSASQHPRICTDGNSSWSSRRQSHRCKYGAVSFFGLNSLNTVIEISSGCEYKL